jgi:hypothetical protein
MLHELHGPLGHARYQEYAHHIAESGGRLLKSSEQALAVTEAMTALMADRGRGRRERLVAATLLREAWRSAAPAGHQGLRLTTCSACDILCERRPTLQAMEHLLREAIAQAPAGGSVEVTGQRRAGNRALVIRAPRSAGTLAEGENGGSKLGVILARLLLETQGANLNCSTTNEMWTATVSFPSGR